MTADLQNESLLMILLRLLRSDPNKNQFKCNAEYQSIKIYKMSITQ